MKQSPLLTCCRCCCWLQIGNFILVIIFLIIQFLAMIW